MSQNGDSNMLIHSAVEPKRNTMKVTAPPTSPRSIILTDLPDLSEGASHNIDACFRPAGKAALLFPWKLQEMLESSSDFGNDDIVSWLPHGNAFKVHDVQEFVTGILPLHFKQTKYKSFQRQLNLWGFKRIEKGPERGAYYHEEFKRSEPHRCWGIRRHQPRKRRSSETGKGGTTSDAKTDDTTMSSSSEPPDAMVHRVRTVSEGSLVEDGSHSDDSMESLELAEFEGFTFHLLEEDRYDELSKTILDSILSDADEPLGVRHPGFRLLKELEEGFIFWHSRVRYA